MKECARYVQVQGEELTCRTWALAALFELANQGSIGMLADWREIRRIEQEAKDQAYLAMSFDEQRVASSQSSVR